MKCLKCWICSVVVLSQWKPSEPSDPDELHINMYIDDGPGQSQDNQLNPPSYGNGSYPHQDTISGESRDYWLDIPSYDYASYPQQHTTSGNKSCNRKCKNKHRRRGRKRNKCKRSCRKKYNHKILKVIQEDKDTSKIPKLSGVVHEKTSKIQNLSHLLSHNILSLIPTLQSIIREDKSKLQTQLLSGHTPPVIQEDTSKIPKESEVVHKKTSKIQNLSHILSHNLLSLIPKLQSIIQEDKSKLEPQHPPGQTPPAPEEINCKSDGSKITIKCNCDGVICPVDRHCIDSICSKSCNPNGSKITTKCDCDGIICPVNRYCIDGVCSKDPPTAANCNSDGNKITTNCNCDGVSCLVGRYCIDGVCSKNGRVGGQNINEDYKEGLQSCKKKCKSKHRRRGKKRRKCHNICWKKYNRKNSKVTQKDTSKILPKLLPEKPKPEITQYVLKSSGDAISLYSELMGTYKLTKDMHNGVPVYKQNSGPGFLYVDSYGNWVVGKNTLNTVNGYAFMYSVERPILSTPPAKEWFYRGYEKWERDPTLRLVSSN